MKSGVFNERLRMIFNQVIEPWGAPTITITPLFYQGVIAGSEFLTYNVNKAYLCVSMTPGHFGNPLNANGFITLYDLANAVFHTVQNQYINFDSTAGQTLRAPAPYEITNCYFSRLTNGTYSTITFFGYRINR
jgi:hypothetical protein